MFGGPRRFRCGLVEDGRWEGSILVRTAAAGGRHRANGEQGRHRRHRHQNGHDLRSASGTSKTATSRPRTLLRRQGPRRGFAMNAVPLRRVVHRPGGADTESFRWADLSFPAQNSQKAHDDSHQCQGDDEIRSSVRFLPLPVDDQAGSTDSTSTLSSPSATCSTFDDLGNESRLGGPIVRRRWRRSGPRRSEVSEAPADTGQPPPPNPPPRVGGISPPTMRRGVVTGAESLARFYTEDAMDLPAGTKRSEPIPVCVLREHAS